MVLRPVLRLSRHQGEQLVGYCAEYRGYLWQQVTPTPSRNQLIREVQALQGCFEQACEQGGAEIDLALTEAECEALRHVFNGLTQCYAAAPASEQRMQQLATLTALRFLVERVLRQAS